MWFLDQLEPGSALYNFPGAVRLNDELDVTALRRALDEVIRRHDVLRTSFPEKDGLPEQLIAPSLDVALPIIDLGSLPESERDSLVQKLMLEEAKRPFNLSQGPLIRFTLLRLDRDQHVFLVTFHHIICDGWSIGIFLRELAELYRAFSEGVLAPLSDLSIQYADYAVWQGELLQGEFLQRQLSYWKERLEVRPSWKCRRTACARQSKAMREHAIASRFPWKSRPRCSN